MKSWDEEKTQGKEIWLGRTYEETGKSEWPAEDLGSQISRTDAFSFDLSEDFLIFEHKSDYSDHIENGLSNV